MYIIFVFYILLHVKNFTTHYLGNTVQDSSSIKQFDTLKLYVILLKSSIFNLFIQNKYNILYFVIS